MTAGEIIISISAKENGKIFVILASRNLKKAAIVLLKKSEKLTEKILIMLIMTQIIATKRKTIATAGKYFLIKFLNLIIKNYLKLKRLVREGYFLSIFDCAGKIEAA